MDHKISEWVGVWRDDLRVDLFCGAAGAVACSLSVLLAWEKCVFIGSLDLIFGLNWNRNKWYPVVSRTDHTVCIICMVFICVIMEHRGSPVWWSNNCDGAGLATELLYNVYLFSTLCGLAWHDMIVCMGAIPGIYL